MVFGSSSLSPSQVTLRFRHQTLRGIARDPRNDAERQAVNDAFCGSTHPFDYAENMFHRKGLPTRTKIIELHAAWLEGETPVIVVTVPTDRMV